MEDGKKEKKYRYDYFVNKDPNPDENWNDCTPSLVSRHLLKKKPEEQKVVNPSQWNTSGTWEERSSSIGDYTDFVEQNKGRLIRSSGLQ